MLCTLQQSTGAFSLLLLILDELHAWTLVLGRRLSCEGGPGMMVLARHAAGGRRLSHGVSHSYSFLPVTWRDFHLLLQTHCNRAAVSISLDWN